MKNHTQTLLVVLKITFVTSAYSFEPMICKENTTTYKDNKIYQRLSRDEIVMAREYPLYRDWVEIQYDGRLVLADGRHLVRVEEMLSTYADKASKAKSNRQKEKYAKKYHELRARYIKLPGSSSYHGRRDGDNWARFVDPVHSLEEDLDYNRLKDVLKREQIKALETDKEIEQLREEMWKQEVKPEIKEHMDELSRSRNALINYDPPIADPYQDLEHDPNDPNPPYKKSFDTSRLDIPQSTIPVSKSTRDWDHILDGAWVWHHVDTRWKSAARFTDRWLSLESNNFKYAAEMNGDVLVLRNPPLRDGRPGSIIFRMHYNDRSMAFSGVHLNGRFAGHSVVLSKVRKSAAD